MKSNRCKLGTGHYLEARVGKAGSNKGRVNYFYAGKREGHVNLCTHIREN